MKYDHWRELIITMLEAGTVNVPHGLLQYYKQIQLNEPQTMLLIHILSFQQQEGKYFPTVGELQSRMAIPGEEVVYHLQQLVSRDYVRIEGDTDAHGLRTERYNLRPLYEKLANCYVQQVSQQLNQIEQERESGLLAKFEQEFGRPLSPIECETLVKWLEEDKLSDELILAALKEAVFSGSLTFRYIDSILLHWQKNRIRTAEEAKQHSLKFRKRSTIYREPQPAKHNEDFPFYNWIK